MKSIKLAALAAVVALAQPAIADVPQDIAIDDHTIYHRRAGELLHPERAAIGRIDLGEPAQQLGVVLRIGGAPAGEARRQWGGRTRSRRRRRTAAICARRGRPVPG